MFGSQLLLTAVTSFEWLDLEEADAFVDNHARPNSDAKAAPVTPGAG